MIICPNCNREFRTEEEIKRHSLPCWKRHNPNYKSQEAPQGKTVVVKKIDNNILDFFNSFQKE